MTGGSRHSALAVAAIALITLTAPAAASAVDLLPNLVAPEPGSPAIAVSRLGDGQDHLLVRFDGFIHNVGTGALEIFGSNPVNGVMTVSGQRITTDGSTRDDTSRHPQIYFETSDGHNHWHLKGAARFSLWNEAGTAEVAAGAKVGFCLEDVDRIDGFAPMNPVYTDFCAQNRPNVSQVREGISRGWQDVYAAKLPFQWVDLSDVAPGRYRLGEQVDPDNFVIESNEADNGPTLAPEIVTVSGYVASPGAVTLTQPQAIVLGAGQFGSPGPYAVRIESAPKHGTLSSPASADVPGGQVIYAPNPGFAGTDSFSFSARDASSPFPVHPRAGLVTVTVPRTGAQSLKRLRLLTKPRFSRRGRFLTVRARARKTGTLRIRVEKGKRRLGSCRKQVRAKHRFRCRIKLRKHASAARAKVVVTLLVNGTPTAFDTLRVPRRVPRT